MGHHHHAHHSHQHSFHVDEDEHLYVLTVHLPKQLLSKEPEESSAWAVSVRCQGGILEIDVTHKSEPESTFSKTLFVNQPVQEEQVRTYVSLQGILEVVIPKQKTNSSRKEPIRPQSPKSPVRRKLGLRSKHSNKHVDEEDNHRAYLDPNSNSPLPPTPPIHRRKKLPAIGKLFRSSKKPLASPMTE